MEHDTDSAVCFVSLTDQGYLCAGYQSHFPFFQVKDKQYWTPSDKQCVTDFFSMIGKDTLNFMHARLPEDTVRRLFKMPERARLEVLQLRV